MIILILADSTTLTYNINQIGEIGDFSQQFMKWYIKNMDLLSPGGINLEFSLYTQIKYTTDRIAGDGNVHIIDAKENVWSIRSFTALNLVWIIEGKFTVGFLTYSEDISS